MLKRAIRLLLVTFMLAACNLPGQSPAGLPGGVVNPDGGEEVAVGQADAESLSRAASALLVQVNRSRFEAGRPPLVASASLSEAAQARADDMATAGYFDHIHPLHGTAEIESLLRTEFPEGRIAELLFLGAGSPTGIPAQALRAWLEDVANRVVLLDQEFDLMGAAIQRGPAGYYAVLVFVEDR